MVEFTDKEIADFFEEREQQITLELAEQMDTVYFLFYYVGKYFQTSKQSNYEIVTPFIIGQTHLDFLAFAVERFQGTCLEVYGYSDLEGEREGRKISFTKTYRGRTSFYDVHNPEPIHYECECIENGEYTGIWKFKDGEHVTMKTQGRFVMRYVENLDEVIKLLEQK